MKGKTGTISYLWTSISNSLNTKGNWEHFFRRIDTSWKQVAGFQIHCWLWIIYIILKLLYLADFKSGRCIFLFWVINKNDSSVFHGGSIFFFSVSFILTILAVAVQETFKTTISRVGGQDCFCRAVCEEEHPDWAVRGRGRCAGCPEPRYPARSAWHWALLLKSSGKLLPGHLHCNADVSGSRFLSLVTRI